MPIKPGSAYDSITFGNTLSLRVDGAVGAMSLSPCGRDAVLAGRRGLFVIDLDDPFAPPRWLHHITSWEVADVQWSPHPSKPNWVVSTSNQKALLWNLARSSDKAIEHILHKHTRAITDINFHPEHPEILATCSVDSFIFSWDLRSPRKPAQSWADWRAGATQVKWNYKNPNIIASSHNNYFYIWDVRKGALPVQKILAHNGKINGLDFSKAHENEIISCSNDLTVKFWDLNKSITEPNVTINTDFPVARARHIPFGFDGCGIMPLRGGDDSIYIVNYKDEVGETALKPSYTFKGHTEPVKDFLWRCRHSPDTYNDDREFQLVTWSKDCDLRLWPINDNVYDKVKFEKYKRRDKKLMDFEYCTYHKEPNSSSIQKSNLKRDSFVSQRVNTKNNKLNHLDWISGVRIGRSAFSPPTDENSHLTGGGIDHSPGNFGEEVSIVGHKFPKIRFEKISVSTGSLVISLNGPTSPDDETLIFIRVEMNFPKSYPSHPPKFSIEESHELNSDIKIEMLSKLNELAKAFTDKDKYCLEPCLRLLMGEKINIELEMLDDPSPVPFEIPTIEENSDRESYLMNDSDSSSDDEEAKMDRQNSVSSILNNPGFNSTPVPRGCGAVWTPSGHLVCFYPPNDDKQKLMSFNEKGFSVKKPRLNNFGKISLGNKLDSANSNKDDDDDTESDTSDDSFANDLDDILQDDISSRAKVPGLFKSYVGLKSYGRNRFKNNLSVPTEKSGTQASGKISKTTKTIVNIFDYRHLIASKYDLACDYRVLGESAENLAKYNSQIALKHGHKEVYECWKLLEMVLVKDVELDNRHLNIDFFLQSDLKKKFLPHELSKNFRFFWGAHPFGSRWLARELIKYYERIGDIQMLAMLSCVLFENLENAEDASISIQTPYHPQSLLQTPFRMTRKTSEALNDTSNPSLIFQREDHIEPRYSISGSISSVEGSIRSFKSPSPERHSYLKKGIPPSLYDVPLFCTTSLVKLNEDLTRSDFSLLRNPEITKRPPNSRDSSYYSTIDKTNGQFIQTNPYFVAPQVKIEIFNEKSLDLYDDVYSMPLLDPKSIAKFKSYREQYANILYSWGLSINRIKILKFNYPSMKEVSNDDSKPSPFNIHKCDVGLRDKEDDSKYNKISKDCNYCGLAVKKRVFLCNTCEHVLHSSCASEWWEEAEECPSGCGCHCLDYVF